MPRTIASRFELQKMLGEGTFAEIWQAVDQTAEPCPRNVAIKIFRPSAAGDPRRPWEPVFNEVAAGLRIGKHINVRSIRAVVYGTHFGVEETPCLVMDYVESVNLAEWLAGQDAPGPDTFHERITVLHHLLSAMAHVHACGVVHRDLSFGNVLVTTSKPHMAILTDFGCAQTEDSVSDELHKETSPIELQPINPPPYSAPASLRDGAARDVYAFAILCYLTLSGRHPLSDDWQSMRTGQWQGEKNPHAMLPRRPLTALAGWMSHDRRLLELSDLLLRCVAADPSVRPASAVFLQREWDVIMR